MDITSSRLLLRTAEAHRSNADTAQLASETVAEEAWATRDIAHLAELELEAMAFSERATEASNACDAAARELERAYAGEALPRLDPTGQRAELGRLAAAARAEANQAAADAHWAKTRESQLFNKLTSFARGGAALDALLDGCQSPRGRAVALCRRP